MPYRSIKKTAKRRNRKTQKGGWKPILSKKSLKSRLKSLSKSRKYSSSRA